MSGPVVSSHRNKYVGLAHRILRLQDFHQEVRPNYVRGCHARCVKKGKVAGSNAATHCTKSTQPHFKACSVAICGVGDHAGTGLTNPPRPWTLCPCPHSWTCRIGAADILDTYFSTANKNEYSRLQTRFDNPDGFRFTTYRRGLFSDVAKWFGMQDVEVGLANLDRDFIIKGNDQ